jgi:hypothetical protein
MCTLSAVLLLVVVVLYIHLKFRFYDLGALLSWGGTGLLAVFFEALPYIALSAWISGMLSSAFLSLFLTLVATWVPLLFLFMIKGMLVAMAAIDVPWLMRIVPWGWRYDLLHGDAGTRLTACAAMCGFAGLFFLLGLWSFRRRDL